MSTSTTTLAQTDKWHDGQRLHVLGTIAVNAGDYAAGGLVIDFQSIGVQSSLVPDNAAVQIWGVGGFVYAYAKGTTIANGKMQVFCETTVATNAPLLEYTATAASAGLLADVIRFHAIFKALR